MKRENRKGRQHPRVGQLLCASTRGGCKGTRRSGGPGDGKGALSGEAGGRCQGGHGRRGGSQRPCPSQGGGPSEYWTGTPSSWETGQAQPKQTDHKVGAQPQVRFLKTTPSLRVLVCKCAYTGMCQAEPSGEGRRRQGWAGVSLCVLLLTEQRKTGLSKEVRGKPAASPDSPVPLGSAVRVC